VGAGRSRPSAGRPVALPGADAPRREGPARVPADPSSRLRHCAWSRRAAREVRPARPGPAWSPDERGVLHDQRGVPVCPAVAPRRRPPRDRARPGDLVVKRRSRSQWPGPRVRHAAVHIRRGGGVAAGRSETADRGCAQRNPRAGTRHLARRPQRSAAVSRCQQVERMEGPSDAPRCLESRRRARAPGPCSAARR
jgi:hypothetical protein